MVVRPRILLIDSYDSFSYNLAALCKRAIPGCDVHIIKNDTLPTSVLVPLLKYFDAAIIGPGPGSPENPLDVGVVRDLWHIEESSLLPIFGVCLGLQSLAVEFGARIKRLKVVKHGQVSDVIHTGTDIFDGVGPIHAVRYHSLHVSLSGDEDLVPLAWADDAEENGQVVMALKHVRKPFWSVQYHPESVCTSGGGEAILRNFWRLAMKWSTSHKRTTALWISQLHSFVGPAWPQTPPKHEPRARSEKVVTSVTTRTVRLRENVDVPLICELLGVQDDHQDFVLLDSAGAAPGRFSIVGCLTHTSPKITYSIGESFVRIRQGEDVSFAELGSSDIWAWLSAFMRRRRARGGAPEVPFWGGLVGYLSYELGAHTLTPIPPRPGSRLRHPDANLVFVERSIVIDSQSKKAYVQSTQPGDEKWLQEVSLRLDSLAAPPSGFFPSISVALSTPQPQPMVTLPNRAEYISKIHAAKEWLFSGDSYELCVTAPTHIRAAKSPMAVAHGTSSSWELYKTLRTRNPAPHSAYLRLHSSTLLSSSPERFLSYSRPPESLCQLRPIKGTVRKVPGITRAVAEEMLAGSRKEVAENLMIVDLIRHDLHSVVGEDVHVRQFCKVEEYETVWQLVSVIEGKQSPHAKNQAQPDLGFDMLRASLPPGSMTGAPKKRSVEILRDLEGQERGIYSGVLGYADVGGGGDWAVIIRSCFKHDEQVTPSTEPSEQVQHPHNGRNEPGALNGASGASPSGTLFEEWTLGAGGAITALSDPIAEWEEMVTKVESVLRAFKDSGAC
ncbi:hypothetical protein BN946_scf185013.g111 [Trametes cinnabarina]|uniref:aminodeoxychorismate synthase n=1 Tax=Pycnoporus cinnabarinus TaxID=5643 RepID=A0A060SH07_PYCCI|nr:hypothetical protein BN946_scf185013.g111 [Trametes cinnabarina]